MIKAQIDANSREVQAGSKFTAVNQQVVKSKGYKKSGNPPMHN